MMKVFIYGKMYDSNTTPVVLIFKDDKDRIFNGDLILNGFEPKDGARYFASVPTGVDALTIFDKVDKALADEN